MPALTLTLADIRGCVMIGALAATLAACETATKQDIISGNRGDAVIVDGSPLLEVGGDTAAGRLYGIVGALRTSDGNLVVADRSQRLLTFDVTGEVIRVSGGRGSGPGEFRNITRIALLAGDSLLVFDAGLRRVTYFSPDGEFTASTGGHNFVGRLGDGRLVSRTDLSGTVRPQPGEIVRTQTELTLHDSAGGVIRSLGFIEGDEVLFTPDQRFEVPTVLRRLVVRTAGRRILYPSRNRFEVEVINENGPEYLRPDIRPISLQPDGLVSYYRARGRNYTHVDFRVESTQTYPLISDLVVDDLNNVWAKHYSGDYAAGSRWTVFSPDGAVVSEVSMPARFDPFHIGDDFVVGVWRDSLNVEVVRVHRVARSS